MQAALSVGVISWKCNVGQCETGSAVGVRHQQQPAAENTARACFLAMCMLGRRLAGGEAVHRPRCTCCACMGVDAGRRPSAGRPPSALAREARPTITHLPINMQLRQGGQPVAPLKHAFAFARGAGQIHLLVGYLLDVQDALDSFNICFYFRAERRGRGVEDHHCRGHLTQGAPDGDARLHSCVIFQSRQPMQ